MNISIRIIDFEADLIFSACAQASNVSFFDRHMLRALSGETREYFA